TWDGKDTGGAIQPPGTYTATLSAAGQTDQIVTITLTRQATATYSYDNLYRLTQATNPWAGTTYSYDPVGNRLTSVIAGASSSYTSDKVDRLTAVGGTTYTNDANGNRTGRGADTFTYDLANRLTQAAISGGSTTNYAYDGDGKRMCSSTPCTTPEYVYDVNRGLPVILQDGTKQYIWGQGLAYTVSGPSIAVHHNDGLGSTRAVTTAAGQVESSYLTDDFGVSKLIRGTNPARMQYTGEPRDSETGFVYLRARMYDPTVGRFLQRDGVAGLRARPQSLHRFAYVENTPTTLVDPSGHYGYKWEWRIGSKGRVGSAEAVMTYFQQHPGNVFPFGLGECSTIEKDKSCHLNVKGWIAPVKIVSVTSTTFRFVAQAGHFDATGSWIQFRIYERDGEIFLEQKAQTLTDDPRTDWLFMALARIDWSQQAANLRKVLTGDPNEPAWPMPTAR
ncbi:MAG: RHS repeat domain-containing protein, partial [Chloroflexota bacterium]